MVLGKEIKPTIASNLIPKTFRNCIGFRFGLMQTRIALIQILLNFRVLPTEKTPIPLKFDPTTPVLSSKNDMWLKLDKL